MQRGEMNNFCYSRSYVENSHVNPNVNLRDAGKRKYDDKGLNSCLICKVISFRGAHKIYFALSLFLYLSVSLSLTRARSVSVLLAVYFSRVTRPRVGVFSLSFRSLLSLFHTSCVVLLHSPPFRPVMCVCVCLCMCVRMRVRTRACVSVCSSRDRLLSAAFEAQLPHAALSYRWYRDGCVYRLFMSGSVHTKSERFRERSCGHKQR